MIKYIKYLLVFLLATGFVACSEDEGAQILGSLYEKVDITPEPGMNLVGRVTDGTGPIEGVVVSDGVTVTTTDAQGIYQMRVKRNAPFVFVSVPAEYEIPVENGMPKIYKKIAMGDNDVVQRSFKLERTGRHAQRNKHENGKQNGADFFHVNTPFLFFGFKSIIKQALHHVNCK